MLACHSPNQFKSSAVSGLGFSRITSRTERIAVYIEIVFHHIWDKQELHSKSSMLQPSHHLAGDEDVVDVLVLGLAI